MTGDCALPVRERTVVLVGLMGAGKTTVGRRLAERLDLRFVDADTEIEAAAGMSIADIFETHGEAHFREGERRVIARLLDEPGQVLATGGGAFMDPETRALIADRAISVWLKADLDVLYHRVARRNTRPLLRLDDPRKVLERLIAERYPVYAEADVTIDVSDEPPESTTNRVLEAITAHLESSAPAGAAT